VLHRVNGAAETLDDDEAVVEWDGTTLTVWRDGCFSKERVFVGGPDGAPAAP
jgi:hypothetical protein